MNKIAEIYASKELVVTYLVLSNRKLTFVVAMLDGSLR